MSPPFTDRSADPAATAAASASSEASEPDPFRCPALVGLDDVERGYVLAVVAAAGSADGEAAAMMLTAPSGSRCARAVRTLTAMDRAERIHLLGVLARATMAPHPGGIEHVIPDVLAQAMAGESSDTLRLMVAPGAPGSIRRAVATILTARSGDEHNATIPTSALPGPDAGPDAAFEVRPQDGAVESPSAPVLAQVQRSVLSSLFPR